MNKTQVAAGEYILSVYDIENFVQISRKLSAAEVFNLIQEIQILTIDTLSECNPLIIKNLGDSNLMVFDKENPDAVLITLYELKEKIEGLLKDKGFPAKSSFSSHYGEIALGKIGKEPFVHMDAFGEELNRTFLLLGKPYRGRFTISPQLFRKLDGATRKRFHKFTPQIMYTAE